MLIAIPVKEARPSEVCAETISARDEVETSVMKETCQRVVDGKRMLDDWQTSVLVPIFNGKGHVTKCRTYRGVKLLKVCHDDC